MLKYRGFMTHPKATPFLPDVAGLTTRREVLRRGAVVAAVSVIAPLWPRFARAQAAPTTFDYYISPNGSDSNPGTLASPWSLNALNSKGSIYGGKSVGIIGDQGTYDCLSIYIAANGGSTLGSTASGVNPAAFNIANGTSGSPTYVASCNSSGVYAARLAVLDGGSTSLSQSAMVNPGGNPMIGAFPSAAYITLDGLVLQNNYYRYIHLGGINDVSDPVPRAPGITVQNCWFGGSGTLYNEVTEENPTYLTLYACDGALIQNNLMDGVVDDTTDRTSAFEQWASINSIIQYNTINSPSSPVYGGIFVKNANNNNNIIRYNFVNLTAAGAGSSAAGICIDDDAPNSYVTSSTDYVYNNIVIADNPVFWNAIGVGSWPNFTHKEVWYNNTFLGVPSSSGGTFWVRFAAPGNITFYNNILYASSQSDFRGMLNSNDGATSGTGSFALIDYNLYSPLAVGMSAYIANGNIPPVPNLVSTIAAWQAQLPTAAIGKDAHSVTTAPAFVGGSPTYPAQYYKLVSGTAGQARGSTNGQTSGSAVDMGAWGGVDVNTEQPIAQIGCNFVAGGTSDSLSVPPSAPVLTVS